MVKVSRKKLSKRQKKILKYLQDGNTLTVMQAFRMWSDTRLSDAIYVLKSFGYIIEGELNYTKDGTRYKVYYMGDG